jgi:hypothetical protein
LEPIFGLMFAKFLNKQGNMPILTTDRRRFDLEMAHLFFEGIGKPSRNKKVACNDYRMPELQFEISTS